jgi:RNA polymerase sigma factor (TIGR02999 family)
VEEGPANPDRATTEITALLHAHAAGDGAALDQLLPRVYGELRRIARLRLRRERNAHTLAATDLVHEAYLKLLPVERIDWRSRAHFFAIASRAMRNVLVDHAVRRGAAKRGAGATVLELEDSSAATTQQPLDDLIALSKALERLERLDARQAQVVECRFFGGLSLDETAAALNTSAATVSRDWTFARAWLHHELAADAPGATPPSGA